MINLLEFREKLRGFYGKNSFMISLVAKFLVCVASFLWINNTIGYCEPLNSILVILAGAAFSAFLPSIVAVLMAFVMILMHLSTLSMEVMLSVLVVFILFMLVYLIFSPGKLFIILLVPLAFYFKIPYVVPLLLGLMGSLAAVIPMSVGVILFFMLQYIKNNSAILVDTGGLTKLQRSIQVINGITDSQSIWFFVLAFVVVLVIVSLLAMLSINYSKEIALLTGGVIELVILLVGALYSAELMKEYSIVTIVVGTLISVAIAWLYQFMVLMLDYKRTEYVQFEDDEYHYYVKAVPKIAVAVSDRKFTTITASKNNHTEHQNDSDKQDDEVSPDCKSIKEEAIYRNYADDF